MISYIWYIILLLHSLPILHKLLNTLKRKKPLLQLSRNFWAIFQKASSSLYLWRIENLHRLCFPILLLEAPCPPPTGWSLCKHFTPSYAKMQKVLFLAANKLNPKLNSFWCGSFGKTSKYFCCFQICMEVGLALSNPFVSVSWEKALDGDLTVPIAWLGRRPPTQCRSVAFSPVGSRLPGATHTSTLF